MTVSQGDSRNDGVGEKIMKPLKKRRVAQKLWGWVSLSINYFIMALFLAEKHAGILGGGILLSAFTLYYGISKIS